MGDIKVLIADDQGLIRESLSIVLNMEDGLNVVGQAEDGEKAIQLCEELAPDVVLMDINMPHLDGVSATETIKEKMAGHQSDDSYILSGCRLCCSCLIIWSGRLSP